MTLRYFTYNFYSSWLTLRDSFRCVSTIAICLSGYHYSMPGPVTRKNIPAPPIKGTHPRQDVCGPMTLSTCIQYAYMNTSPLRNSPRFWQRFAPLHSGKGQPGFILHTITGFHWPGFTHYYGFICHLTSTYTLSFLLSLCFQKNNNIGNDARLPRLLHRLPVRNPTPKHKTGLTEYWALRYFERSPTCPAESGSFPLCTSDFLWLPSDPAVSQQRPCHSDYLPPSRGDAAFLQAAGFAGFAGQTKKAPYRCPDCCVVYWRSGRDSNPRPPA